MNKNPSKNANPLKLKYIYYLAVAEPIFKHDTILETYKLDFFKLDLHLCRLMVTIICMVSFFSGFSYAGNPKKII